MLKVSYAMIVRSIIEGDKKWINHYNYF
jgi:hypothetical protein